MAIMLHRQHVVINCSDQIDYKILEKLMKGIAQTGAWGIFDEFNRIPVEVIATFAQQVKVFLQARA